MSDKPGGYVGQAGDAVIAWNERESAKIKK
jgi:hypothetical protein